jgi:transposase-like protein
MDFAVGGTEPHRVRIDTKLVCLIGATTVQTCIVHLIRQSPKYVPHRQCEQVVKDLRPIYTAINADAAMRALEAFEEKWGQQLPS